MGHWNRRQSRQDRKSTRLNSSHTEIYTLSLHDALPILSRLAIGTVNELEAPEGTAVGAIVVDGTLESATIETRSEEHTSELQSHRDLHSFPTRRSSDLVSIGNRYGE